jgi:hypothetical protein
LGAVRIQFGTESGGARGERLPQTNSQTKSKF